MASHKDSQNITLKSPQPFKTSLIWWSATSFLFWKVKLNYHCPWQLQQASSWLSQVHLGVHHVTGAHVHLEYTFTTHAGVPSVASTEDNMEATPSQIAANFWPIWDKSRGHWSTIWAVASARNLSLPPISTLQTFCKLTSDGTDEKWMFSQSNIFHLCTCPPAWKLGGQLTKRRGEARNVRYRTIRNIWTG